MFKFFKCKHKSVKVVECKEELNYFFVECVNCGERIKKFKGVGEVYRIGMTIKQEV